MRRQSVCVGKGFAILLAVYECNEHMLDMFSWVHVCVWGVSLHIYVNEPYASIFRLHTYHLCEYVCADTGLFCATDCQRRSGPSPLPLEFGWCRHWCLLSEGFLRKPTAPPLWLHTDPHPVCFPGFVPASASPARWLYLGRVGWLWEGVETEARECGISGRSHGKGLWDVQLE